MRKELLSQKEFKKLYGKHPDVFKCDKCKKYYWDWYVPYRVWEQTIPKKYKNRRKTLKLCKQCFIKLRKKKGLSPKIRELTLKEITLGKGW